MKKKLIAAVAGGVVVLGGAGASAYELTGTHHHPDPTASQLARTLVADGLPVSNIKVYNASTDPNHELGRQGDYISKVNFTIASATQNSDGSAAGASGIEVFASTGDAQARYSYVSGFKGTIVGDGYDHLGPNGLAFLRLDSGLTPTQARAFEAAFDKAEDGQQVRTDFAASKPAPKPVAAVTPRVQVPAKPAQQTPAEPAQQAQPTQSAQATPTPAQSHAPGTYEDLTNILHPTYTQLDTYPRTPVSSGEYQLCYLEPQQAAADGLVCPPS